MQKRLFSLIALFAIISLIFTGAASTTAQEPTSTFDKADLVQRLRNGERVRAKAADVLPADMLARLQAGAQRTQGLTNVVIELSDDPTAVVYAAETARSSERQATLAAQAQLAKVEQAQQRLLTDLSALNATVIYRTQRVYNGVAVQLDASQLARLNKLSGVKAVHPLIAKTFENASSVPLIGAPQLWDGSAVPGGVNVAGQGMKIGIIDTGIDYTHANFGGPGTVAAYDNNDPTVITDTTFPTAKVVGGYDFVGDDYNANDPASMPMPDPDPLDCNGHGSHVAGTAAGYGVTVTGDTYAGPYNPNIYTNTNFRIGPGVAPEASLYALKVFGCTGSTNVTDVAIEWAVDPNGDGDFSDRLDVINMSLGSDDGSPYDTTAVASDNAVLAGVIVVASAGNSSDSYYITGSPSSSDRTISVAASADAQSILDGFLVNAPTIEISAGVYPGKESVAFDWANSTPVTGKLVYISSNACAPFDAATTAIITGNIVLIDWTDGACGSVTRGKNLRLAGAKGFLIADNSEVFDLNITGDTVIPGMSIPMVTGEQLKEELAANPNLTVTLSHAYVNSVVYNDTAIEDTLADFSSRGPRRAGSDLKPDIAAPGLSIFSTAVGTGDQGVSFNGTSMAAPHMAGSMALLRQLHPAWQVEELKALAMNTALKPLRAGLDPNSDIYAPQRVGAGRVDLPGAANSEVIAYNNGNIGYVNVSFGDVEVLNTMTLTKSIRILNKGTTAQTHVVGYTPATTIPGVTYTTSPYSVTVAPGGVGTVQVTMQADPALMRHTHDTTVSETQSGLPRHWMAEAGGRVTFTPMSMAPAMFGSALNGFNEVPLPDFSNSATFADDRAHATAEFDPATMQLTYDITFTSTITATAAHIHRGRAGEAGPVAFPISTGGTYSSTNGLSGTVTLAASDVQLLYQGRLYFNFHNADFPFGFLRGQIVIAEPALVVPVYSTARPSSNMHAEQTSFDFTNVFSGTTDVTTATGVITLTGKPVLTGMNTPYDEVSVMTAYELAYTSPDEQGGGDTNVESLVNNADLAYVGVTSTYVPPVAGMTPTIPLTDSVTVFGIATHGEWSTPAETEFDIYIDTDRDGAADFVLFNWDYASANDANDREDVFITVLVDLNTGDLFLSDFLNGVDASMLDTYVFNNNVMALPMYPSELGMTEGNAAFDYYVVTFSRDADGVIDATPDLSFNPAQPSVVFEGALLGNGYVDAPGTVPFTFNRASATTSSFDGILLLHHHNNEGLRTDEVVNNRIDVIDVESVDLYRLYLPLVLNAGTPTR